LAGIWPDHNWDAVMPIKVDKSGLEQLKKNLESLGNTKSVTLVELMNPAFVAAHSKFNDLESLFNAFVDAA
jgi:hypothetical protein